MPNRLDFQNREEIRAKRKIVLEQILADIKKVKAPEKRASFLSDAGRNFCVEGDKINAEKRLSLVLYSQALNSLKLEKKII